ncbi:hypothetical protein [Halostagnicola sp. A56]|nr:hypothetical protein [Halostagnicola sp. A56]
MSTDQSVRNLRLLISIGGLALVIQSVVFQGTFGTDSTADERIGVAKSI